jgi:hypothetical protein
MNATQETLVRALQGIETSLVQLAQHVATFDETHDGLLHQAFRTARGGASGVQAQEGIRAVVSLERLDKVIIGRLRDLGLGHLLDEVSRNAGSPYLIPAEWVDEWSGKVQRVVR